MKLILDTADIEQIKHLNDILAVDGVTTNPSIIAKTGRDVKEIINDLLEVLNEDQLIFVQVVANDYEGIMEEAKYIASLGKNCHPKIPVTEAGLKAIKECKKLGIGVLATAIYSAEEALLAAKNGAMCLAPYVNRMCNFGDGVQEVIDLQRMLDVYGFDTYIVAASFKNCLQVHELWKAGIEAVTVPVDVCRNLYGHPATKQAVCDFNRDWEKAYNRKTLI